MEGFQIEAFLYTNHSKVHSKSIKKNDEKQKPNSSKLKKFEMKKKIL